LPSNSCLTFHSVRIENSDFNDVQEAEGTNYARHRNVASVGALLRLVLQPPEPMALERPFRAPRLGPETRGFFKRDV
jgi:hypothetical protein